MNKTEFESALHAIGDLAQPIDPVLQHLLAGWRYDLYARSPGPAVLENGILKPTDLDLACFLSALVDRGAVVNIPTYTSRRARTEKEGERVLSRENRHGKCLGLSSNKEAFSFSLRIEDANVVTSDTVGAPRNFMLVDVDGEWHRGWRAIEFMPNRSENAFLSDHKLWTGNRVVFENFVHPNRWSSLYGRSYLVSKLVLDRMQAEAEHLFAESKRLTEMGICADFGVISGIKIDHEGEYPKTSTGPSIPIKVKAFEVEVDGLRYHYGFPQVAATPQAHADALTRRRYLIYTAAPLLRFATRACELAFVTFDGMSRTPPSWAVGFSSWTRGVVLPGKRIEWTVGKVEGGLELRHRLYTKTERVAA